MSELNNLYIYDTLNFNKHIFFNQSKTKDTKLINNQLNDNLNRFKTPKEVEVNESYNRNIVNSVFKIDKRNFIFTPKESI